MFGRLIKDIIIILYYITHNPYQYIEDENEDGLCNQWTSESFAPFTGAGEANDASAAGEAFSDTG